MKKLQFIVVAFVIWCVAVSVFSVAYFSFPYIFAKKEKGEIREQAVVKGSGVLYYDSIPDTTPDTTGSELAWGIKDNSFWGWSRASNQWNQIGTNRPLSPNTWYVSKFGDNTTGQKGNPFKPLLDPWSAKDSAVAGDQIFVYEGLYTSGIVGSGADRENNGTDLEYTALNKDSVTLVLDAGAQVQNTAAILQPLFYDTIGQKFTVVGEGQIRNLDSRARLAYIDNENSDLYINIYKVTNGENAASWSYGFYLINWSRFEVLTEISEVSNSRFIYTPATSNVVDASFTYSTKDFYIPSVTDATFNFNRGTFKNGSIDINMQNVYGNPLYTFIFTGLGLDSSVMNINIGAMNLTGFNASYGPFSLSPNNGAALKNSVINFNCDACQADANMFSLGRANGANEKSFFRITGNYYSTSLLQPLLKFGAQVVNTPIYIDAVMTTLHTPVIQKNNQADLYLSGVFETYADTNVIVSSNTSGRTTLGNLQIKQPAGATSVSIRSTVPDTINTYSAYSLAATSSNVTFKNLTEYGASTASLGNTIYNANDALTGNRTVTGAGNSLSFSGMSSISTLTPFVNILNNVSTTSPAINLYDNTDTKYIGLYAQDLIESTFYAFPDTVGTTGQVLHVEKLGAGSGKLYWADDLTAGAGISSAKIENIESWDDNIKQNYPAILFTLIVNFILTFLTKKAWP